jgi:hypothetical protein
MPSEEEEGKGILIIDDGSPQQGTVQKMANIE